MSEVTNTNTKKVTLSEDVNTKMAEISSQHATTSAKIRALHAEGYARADIARHLNIIYQHVRNVLVTKTKKHAPL